MCAQRILCDRSLSIIIGSRHHYYYHFASETAEAWQEFLP